MPSMKIGGIFCFIRGSCPHAPQRYFQYFYTIVVTQRFIFFCHGCTETRNILLSMIALPYSKRFNHRGHKDKSQRNSIDYHELSV